jgi:hypothetical protein
MALGAGDSRWNEFTRLRGNDELLQVIQDLPVVLQPSMFQLRAR